MISLRGDTGSEVVVIPSGQQWRREGCSLLFIGSIVRCHGLDERASGTCNASGLRGAAGHFGDGCHPSLDRFGAWFSSWSLGRGECPEAGCHHHHHGHRGGPGEPVSWCRPDVRRPQRPVRGTTGERGEHRHLQELQRRAIFGALLPHRRWRQLHLRDRRVRRHGQPVRDLLEYGRPAGEEPARPLQRRHEPHRVAEVRLRPLHRLGGSGPALFRRLSGMGRQAVQLGGLPALSPFRERAHQRQGAVEDLVVVGEFQLRHVYGATLAEDRDGHVHARRPGDDTKPLNRIRPSDQ